MVDYYKEMRIPAYSSELAIKPKLNTLRGARREGAEFILLDPSRKRIYDNHHRQLVKIGKLRATANLTSSGSWGREFSNFIPDRSIAELVMGGVLGFLRGVWEIVSVIGLSLLIRVGPLAVIIGIIFLSTFFITHESAEEKEDRLRKQRERIERYEAEHPRLSLPNTGVLSKSYYEGVAPLKIRTPSGGANYYVKMVNSGTKRIVMTSFIRAGHTFETLMPLGSYELRYATGTHWYGEEELFGRNTSRSKADDVFVFRKTHQGYEGHTVELILQTQGNLRTERMSEDAF